MNFFCTFKFIAAVAAITSFTACSDYLDSSNGENANGRIGLPGNVNIINTENSNSPSRSIDGNLIFTQEHQLEVQIQFISDTQQLQE